MQTTHARALLVIDGVPATPGEKVEHSEYGSVQLEHSEAHGWHYLRWGHAGFGTDTENLFRKDGYKLDLTRPLVDSEGRSHKLAYVGPAEFITERCGLLFQWGRERHDCRTAGETQLTIRNGEGR